MRFRLFFPILSLFITINANAAPSEVSLTPDEQRWLAKHSEIVLGIEESWAPMVIKNKDGSLSGIDADTVDHLNGVLGTNITFMVGKWSTLDAMLKKGEIDGLSSAAADPGRKAYASYTDTYTTTVKSIFVQKGNLAHIHKPADLSGKKVAIQKGNLFDEKIVKRYPDVTIVYADDYRESADLVLSKKADAFIGSDMTHYNLTDIGITSVVPASTIGEPMNLVFAIRKDWPELVAILNKGLATLSLQQRKTIKERYIAKAPEFNYTLLLQVLLAALSVVAVLVWWNRSLTRKVKEGIERYKIQQRQLIQQSKMAAMGEMINMIAHQWKQPLNVISLSAQEIEEIIKYENSDRQMLEEVEKSILEQVDYMNTTINDFRNFFKPSDEAVYFKACEVAKAVQKLIEAKMKKFNIRFVAHEHVCFEVLGVPNEFKQVLMNIYNNACDAVQERKTKNPTIELMFENDGHMATIRIRDNGGGISEELLPDKLFEPYISTKGNQGTGIGMQISRMIIEEKFQGKLRAHNVEDGAEFVIELPLESPQPKR